MCGRFSQSMTREEYLSLFANEADRNIAYDPEPIGRYNVAPGTRVLLLSERDEQLQLDPVHWGYAPGWWDKPPLINARVETAAGCLNLFGSTVGRSALLMAGLNGSVKETRSSPISSTVKMASQSSWPRSEALPLSVVMRRKGF